MRKNFAWMGAGAACALAVVVGMGATAQPEGGIKKPPPPFPQPSPDEMAGMMEKYIELGQPGPHHEFLQSFVGEWDVTIRMWMAGPDAPPTEEKASVTAQPILDGRFVLESMNGTLMGMPYEAYTVLGYDNFKQKYTAMHIDNMGTAMSFGEGFSYPPGEVITMWGVMDEPILGLRDLPVRYVTKIRDENHTLFEIHDFNYPDGQTRVMEMEYVRKTD